MHVALFSSYRADILGILISLYMLQYTASGLLHWYHFTGLHINDLNLHVLKLYRDLFRHQIRMFGYLCLLRLPLIQSVPNTYTHTSSRLFTLGNSRNLTTLAQEHWNQNDVYVRMLRELLVHLPLLTNGIRTTEATCLKSETENYNRYSLGSKWHIGIEFSQVNYTLLPKRDYFQRNISTAMNKHNNTSPCVQWHLLCCIVNTVSNTELFSV